MATPRNLGLKIDMTGPTPPLAIELEKNGSTSVLYVRVADAKIATTREMETDVLADYDAAGKLVGFEVIGLKPGLSAQILGRIRRKFEAQMPSLALLDELIPA